MSIFDSDYSWIVHKRKGDSTDSFPTITEQISVVNGKAILRELPNKFNGITISDLTKTFFIKYQGTPDKDNVVIDLNSGYAYFDAQYNNKQYTAVYSGEGVYFLNSRRVFTQVDNNNDVAQTLDDFVTSVGADLTHKGVWDSSATYVKRNIVFYNNASYMCIKACTNIIPTDTTYWQFLMGHFNHLGSFDATKIYKPMDAVEYVGSSYMCVKTTTAGVLPTDILYWVLLASGVSVAMQRSTINIASDTRNVPIGIQTFNSQRDTLMVFQNMAYIEQGVDYNIAADGISIDRIDAQNWKTGTQFNFVSLKNITNNVNGTDASLLQPDGITNSKLSTDIKVGSLSTLNTIDKSNITNALNEDIARRKDFGVNVKDFGAKGDGIADDTNAIEAAKSAGRIVYFPTGTYRITRSIDPGSYRSFIGAHPTQTKIITNQDINIFYSPMSVDNAYLIMKSFTLEYDGVNPSTKAAIRLEGDAASPYNGVAYGVFEDLYIKKFKDGFWGCSFWCTNFRQVRTVASVRAGIVLGHSTNDITIEDCMLYNGQYGVIASVYETVGGQAGASLTSISLKNSDIEACSTAAIKLDAIEGFTCDSLHTEGLSLVIDADSVPGLMISGGRYASINTLLQIRKSFTSGNYSGYPTIRGGFCKVTKNTPGGVINFPYTNEVNYADVQNLTIYNNGTAKAIVFQNNASQVITYGTKKKKPDIITATARIRNAGTDFIEHTIDLSDEPDGYVKMAYATLVCDVGGTTTNADVFQIKDAGGTVLWELQSIAAGVTITPGQQWVMNRIVTGYDLAKMIFKTGDKLKLTNLYTLGIDAQFHVVFTNVYYAPVM